VNLSSIADFTSCNFALEILFPFFDSFINLCLDDSEILSLIDPVHGDSPWTATLVYT